MQIKEIMTANPACCTPQSKLADVARLMVDFDCGEIPVVDDFTNGVPIGVITDRDIVCRTLGKGLNPLEMTVSDCMSAPLVSVLPNNSLDECYKLLEDNQIRRVPVVDVAGKCIGIVSLADIARNVPQKDAGEILREVSATSLGASNVG